ncbi:MAG: protein-S-isoprenylcysteine O-methyltransferase [Pseudomonadota bacterium]
MINKLIPYAIMAAAFAAAIWRDAPYAALPFIAALVGSYTIRLLITQNHDREVSEERDAGRERPLAMTVAFGMVFIPIVILAFPVADFAAYTPFPGQVAFGFVLAVIGLYAFWRSHSDLGNLWSAHLELREGHTLVTQGIYARVRHPMYTAIFLHVLGQLFMFANWIAAPAGLITFGLLYLLRVGPEEKMMHDTFGTEWEAYAARTPRLLPRLVSPAS